MLELLVRNKPCRPQQSGDKTHGSCDFSFHFDQLYSRTHRLTENIKRYFFFLSKSREVGGGGGSVWFKKNRKLDVGNFFQKKIWYEMSVGGKFLNSILTTSSAILGPKNKTRRSIFLSFVPIKTTTFSEVFFLSQRHAGSLFGVFFLFFLSLSVFFWLW